MNTYKKRNFLIMCCLLLVFTLTAFSTFFNNKRNVHAAVPEGVETAVVEDSVTMYYLTLPTKDKRLITTNPDVVTVIARPDSFSVWSVWSVAREKTNNRTLTFVLTYNNILVNGFPLLTTWNIEVSSECWNNIFAEGHLTFIPKNDININIRSEYYELFQNGDFSEVTITFMYLGEGYKFATTDRRPDHLQNFIFDLSGATLHTRQVPPDYDPIIEEGQAPDNGGVILDPYVPPPIPPPFFSWPKFPWPKLPNLNTFILALVLFLAIILVRNNKK